MDYDSQQCVFSNEWLVVLLGLPGAYCSWTPPSPLEPGQAAPGEPICCFSAWVISLSSSSTGECRVFTSLHFDLLGYQVAQVLTNQTQHKYPAYQHHEERPLVSLPLPFAGRSRFIDTIHATTTSRHSDLPSARPDLSAKRGLLPGAYMWNSTLSRTWMPVWCMKGSPVERVKSNLVL